VNVLNGQSFLPSFEEIAVMIHLIGRCEDEKYQHGKGRRLVSRFLEAISPHKSYSNKGIIGFVTEVCRRFGVYGDLPIVADFRSDARLSNPPRCGGGVDHAAK
jgi:hypothetical protein